MQHITLIFGGKSAEHHVSIRSALSIIDNNDYKKYSLDILYLSLTGQFYYYKKIYTKNTAKTFLKNFQNHLDLSKQDNEVTHAQVLSYLQQTDVVFSLLHGKNGEDGVMQGMLEFLGVAYIGSDVRSSAITMDKICTKRMLQSQGIKVTPFVGFLESDYMLRKNHILDEISQKLVFPLFVKPSSFGSSIGVAKVRNNSDLQKAIESIIAIDKQVLVEKAIDAKEVEVAILQNIDPTKSAFVSPAGEIRVKDEFYTYQAKYIKKDKADFIIPADLHEKQISELKILTEKIFKYCGCSGMARVDFFVERVSGLIYFNEINTIPGFTNISLYPRLLMAANFSYSQIIEQLFNLAVTKKEQNKAKIKKEMKFLKTYTN